MQNKKIAIIGTVGLPASYGGFETLVEYLTKYLADQYDMTVFCSGVSYKNKLKHYNNARLKYLPLKANGAQSIIYDIFSIFNSLFFADILLILGVSGCIVLPLIKLISRKKIIVNIDGLEWKRDKWKKPIKWFLKFSEKIAVKFADEIVADNLEIKRYVQKEYGVSAHLIPYGGDHVSKEEISTKTELDYPFLKGRFAFKVCRIEPENNIEMILEAFSEVDKIPLIIIGNWEKNDFGKDMKSKYSEFKHIHLLDPIYNQKLLNEIRSSCYIYIHGHSAGGTNPSLVEAMYLKLPIFAFDINYNRETTKNKGLYFQNKEELKNLLLHHEGYDLNKLGSSMYQIATENYRWKIIANKYASLLE